MKTLLIFVMCISVYGCGFMSYEDVEQRSKACESKGGTTEMAVNRNKRVLWVYCRMQDGTRYEIQEDGKF